MQLACRIGLSANLLCWAYKETTASCPHRNLAFLACLPSVQAAVAGDETVSETIQGRSEAGNGAGNSHEGLRDAPGQERERPWSKLDAIFAKAAAERHASMQAVSGQAHGEGVFGGAFYPAWPYILCMRPGFIFCLRTQQLQTQDGRM